VEKHIKLSPHSFRLNALGALVSSNAALSTHGGSERSVVITERRRGIRDLVFICCLAQAPAGHQHSGRQISFNDARRTREQSGFNRDSTGIHRRRYFDRPHWLTGEM
jgi:hypothetical protein